MSRVSEAEVLGHAHTQEVDEGATLPQPNSGRHVLTAFRAQGGGSPPTVEAIRTYPVLGARIHAVLDKRFCSNLGTRMATLSRRLAQLGHWALSDEVFAKAFSMMAPALKLKHGIHRMMMHLMGCTLLDKVGLM